MKLAIGQKIKALRMAAELTQAELADRAKLTKGFISQIENEQTSISLDSLGDIVDALGLTMSEFFSEDGESERIIFTSADHIPLTDRGAAGFYILIPGSTNNLMDPLLVTLAPGEELPMEEPHSGEEFGYVLTGTIQIRYGKKKYLARKKDCFYFESDRRHQYMNTGRSKATFVWVTSPPQM
jgi:transcriptional regulator with XRE-family HTH domain